MKVIKTIALCILILGLTAGTIWTLDRFKTEPEYSQPEVKPRVVRSLVAEAKTRRIDVETQGTVVPTTEIELIAQVSGVAVRVAPSMQSGGFFAKDDVLVQLDDRDYTLAVTRAKAQVAQTELRVSQEQAAAAIARREWKAVGKGEATALALREPQVLEAKAALAAAEAALAKARLDLERTTIRAPFHGRVRTERIDRGQFVALGAMLARVYAVETAEVRLPLHDRDLRYLDLPLGFRTSDSRATMPTVTLRARFAQATHEWTGRIVRTEGELDGKSRMVHAIARVEDPFGRASGSNRLPLSVGMFVTAMIHGRSFDDVVEVPREALRGADEIFVVDDESRLRRRRVEVLHRGTQSVTIAKGVDDGERICLSSIAVFIDGMKVALESEGEK